MSIEEIKAAVRRAEAKKQKLAMFHFQVLTYADELAGANPENFCKELAVPPNYASEFRQMMALARLMKEQGARVLS